jgi:hypothetical protein
VSEGWCSSVSHRDKEWLDKLKDHLSPLECQGKVFVWADTGIEAGEQWREQIRAALPAAGVAVFLVSPAFLASDFINKSELP